ncbi:helix-turn-helix domain-containing protein [Candidatus Omnitrophota bacterium]
MNFFVPKCLKNRQFKIMKDIADKLDEFFMKSSDKELYDKVISHVEKLIIEKMLERSYGNQVMASKMLGLNRNTLHKKIKKLNIDVQRFKI